MGVVDAFENWQGINYVAGLLDELGISDLDLTVRVRIAQPRAYHADGPIREWVVKGHELRGYINTLHNNAQKALSADATTLTGDHCRYCEARHACPAALKAGMVLLEIAGQPLPDELSMEAMALQYSIIQRGIKQLEYLSAGYEEQLKSAIRSGKQVPGFTLEQKYARSAKWTASLDEVVSMGKSVGVDLLKPRELVTPAQAKQLGLDKDIVSSFSEREARGLALTPVNDKKLTEVFK